MSVAIPIKNQRPSGPHHNGSHKQLCKRLTKQIHLKPIHLHTDLVTNKKALSRDRAF
jgi:hypothetical protein